MKKNHYKKIIVLTIFFVAVFFNFKTTFASVIYSSTGTGTPYSADGLQGDRLVLMPEYNDSDIGGNFATSNFIWWPNAQIGSYILRVKLLAGVCSNLTGSMYASGYSASIGIPNGIENISGYCDFNLSVYNGGGAGGNYNNFFIHDEITNSFILDGSTSNNGSVARTLGGAPWYAKIGTGGIYFELADSAGFPPSGTCSDGIQNQDETGVDVGGVCGYPPETCVDGIQNQDETGVDVGGVCFYVSLNWPENASTVPDFADWTVAYYGNDANETSPTLQKGVMWAENADILDICLNYPSETATYNTCFNGTYPIYIDYGLPVWVSASDYVSYIAKTGTMTAGKTYFARAILYTIDDATNTRNILISYSDKIGFIIDNTIGTGGETGKCKANDLGCIFTAVIKNLFSPSQASLEQFGDFKTLLEQKAPFGYAIAIYSEITTLHYDANSTVLVLEQVPQITTLIFTPLRTGLAWLFWFAFAFFLVKRFKDINI